MSDERTGDLIDDLVADLSPVARVPRLRVALAAVLGAWAVSFLIALPVEQTGSEFPARVLTSGSAFVVTLALGLAALFGALTGLASSVPGREELQRQASRLSLGGLAVATATALLAAILSDAPRIAPMLRDAGCFGFGVGLGLLPGGALLLLVRRGWVQRPRLAAAMALIGGFGLGALTIQMLCPIDAARHMLFGHVGVPIVMTLALVFPLGFALGRSAR